jgi:hypothetical protein
MISPSPYLPPDASVFAAFVGLDWADQKHDVMLYDQRGGKPEHSQLTHSPEAIDEWACGLRLGFSQLFFAGALLQLRRLVFVECSIRARGRASRAFCRVCDFDGHRGERGPGRNREGSSWDERPCAATGTGHPHIPGQLGCMLA